MSQVCTPYGIFSALERDMEFLAEESTEAHREWLELCGEIVTLLTVQELETDLSPESFIATRRKILLHIVGKNWIRRFLENSELRYQTKITKDALMSSQNRDLEDLIITFDEMLDDLDEYLSGSTAAEFLSSTEPEAGHLYASTIDLWRSGACRTISDLLVIQPYPLLRPSP